MLALRDTSKITLLATLIIMVSAAGVFAKARQGGRSRNRSDRRPQQAKQPQAAPGQAAQSRGAAPQNSRSVQTTPTGPQAVRTSPVIRRPVARRDITPQRSTNVSVRQPRTMIKTIAPKTPVTRASAVSPRPVNREVKTVTRTELKKTFRTVTQSAPAKQPIPRIITTPTPIRRRTEVRGEPLTKRRQSTPIPTNPVTTPAKETSPDSTKRIMSPERAKRQRPAEQESRTVKVTERAQTEETVKHQQEMKKVVNNRTAHRETFIKSQRRGRGNEYRENRFKRPKEIKTTVAKDTSRKRDGLHGGHNIYHDRRIDRPRISKTTIVIGDTSNGKRDRHGFHHHKRVHGRRPGRIFSRVVWPSYHYRICYDWGQRIIWRYVRPHYHRKYVFVSIGGYWPLYCRPLRYCWYSHHPFVWYGSYPTAYEISGNTYNYYSYNTTYSTGVSGPLEGVDETTFEDVRQRLAEQAAQEPEPETLADKFFEEGVKAFEEGDYEAAAKAFADATALEPNDLVLPFAYAQALFANEQYYQAAEILRLGLVNLPPDKEGIFFPRGLYADDEILFEQIEQLKGKTEIFPFDADYKFLLGYQYIGIGEYDQAEELLTEASAYERNTEATEILLRLLEKIKETV